MALPALACGTQAFPDAESSIVARPYVAIFTAIKDLAINYPDDPKPYMPDSLAVND